jgi:hypothetical protein
MRKVWFPVTPAGTVLTWLPADTASAAWARLLEDASHMPYHGQLEFEKRGYNVMYLPATMTTAPPASYKFSTGPK